MNSNNYFGYQLYYRHYFDTEI